MDQAGVLLLQVRDPERPLGEGGADLLTPIHVSCGEVSPERLHHDLVGAMPAPEQTAQRPVDPAVASKGRSAAVDEGLEEVFGRVPHLTEKEHMWFGQVDEDGQPEVMDEKMEEATIKELLRLAVATGERLNISRLLAYTFRVLHWVANISALFVFYSGVDKVLPHEEQLP